MAAKKSSPRKKAARSSRSSSSKGRGKVQKVMHEFKHGELKSGGRRKVKNPKQAIAIGLSEARRAGADIPGKRSATSKKKRAAKRTPKKGAKKSARGTKTRKKS